MKSMHCAIFTLICFSALSQPDNKMIYVPGGDYFMEQDSKVINIPSFLMDMSEVTIGQFEKFIAETFYVTQAERIGYSTTEGGKIIYGANWRCDERGKERPRADYDRYPVVYVTWDDAMAYSRWAGKRLPSEAEWEYAFREAKNSQFRFAGSNNFRRVAWNSEDPEVNGIQVVATKSPNALGIYDLSGNVSEMCVDQFDKEGKRKPLFVKVAKGGSYVDHINMMTYKARIPCGNYHSFFVGFRCIKDI